MFRGPGEKELLRTCLYGENPWQHSETGSRLRSWERTAEAASSFTTITVEDSDGIHEVDARAVQGACMNEAAVDRLINYALPQTADGVYEIARVRVGSLF